MRPWTENPGGGRRPGEGGGSNGAPIPAILLSLFVRVLKSAGMPDGTSGMGQLDFLDTSPIRVLATGPPDVFKARGRSSQQDCGG